jgi:hypothetical protein
VVIRFGTPDVRTSAVAGVVSGDVAMETIIWYQDYRRFKPESTARLTGTPVCRQKNSGAAEDRILQTMYRLVNRWETNFATLVHRSSKCGTID